MWPSSVHEGFDLYSTKCLRGNKEWKATKLPTNNKTNFLYQPLLCGTCMNTPPSQWTSCALIRLMLARKIFCRCRTQNNNSERKTYFVTLCASYIKVIFWFPPCSLWNNGWISAIENTPYASWHMRIQEQQQGTNHCPWENSNVEPVRKK